VSRIDDLLAKFCPKGVPFKTIGDISELVRGNGLPKSDFVEFGVGCIHYGQIYTSYGTWTTKTLSFIAEEKSTRLAKVDPGDLVVTNTSENVADVCKAVAWLGDSQIVTGGHATVLKHSQEPKYLAYYFQTSRFFAEKRKHATGTKVVDVSAKSLAKIRIPVPPTAVQREIVKVLDNFAELEAALGSELEAELQARRQQYQYYRDALLNPSEQASPHSQWKSLGEVGAFTRGRRFTNKDFVESGLGCIHYGEIYTHYGLSATKTKSFLRPALAATLRMAKKGDLIVAGTGESVEEICKAVAWLGEDDVAVHDDCYIYAHSLDPKFAAYVFQSSHFNEQKVKYAAGAKMIRVSSGSLEKIRIPVPPIEVQRRIVAVLDQFDALVSDLSVDLPAESKARRKQYEYYRDRLLTFQEAAGPCGLLRIA
jgi:type I restriction enzyme, S subunit